MSDDLLLFHVVSMGVQDRDVTKVSIRWQGLLRAEFGCKPRDREGDSHIDCFPDMDHPADWTHAYPRRGYVLRKLAGCLLARLAQKSVMEVEHNCSVAGVDHRNSNDFGLTETDLAKTGSRRR